MAKISKIEKINLAEELSSPPEVDIGVKVYFVMVQDKLNEVIEAINGQHE
jgi:hypothetical protein